VWAGACAGELLGLRGGLECSDLDYLRSALDGKRGAWERQPTKHVRTHTHKFNPLNHFTVVPHPLSPLRFNRLWAQLALDLVLRGRGFEIRHGCAPGGGRRNLQERQFRVVGQTSLALRSWGER